MRNFICKLNEKMVRIALNMLHCETEAFIRKQQTQHYQGGIYWHEICMNIV
jgi:hypothetical protein